MSEERKVNALIEAVRAQKALEEASIPSIEELCLKRPLYDAVEVSSRNFMQRLRTGNWQFDAHCIYCGRDSTFKTARNYGTGSGQRVDADWMLKSCEIEIEVNCQRNSAHKYRFIFSFDGKNLTKFGQYPSLEDIAGADIRKYEKLLPKGYFSELKRATGLASHGIGIGAFVYLRRIFEKLIYDHHDELKKAGNPVIDFEQKRMDEKIAALKDVLPPALVENKAAYSILSSGIHELDEDTCRKYFPVVRQAIITILEQDLQKRQREQEAKLLRDEIAKVAGELKGRSLTATEGPAG